MPLTRLVVKPWPTNIESTLDYFGNIANFFTVQEAHQKLTVTSVSKVRMTEPVPPPASSSPWETVRDWLAVDRSRPILDAYQFVFESPHVTLSDELAAYGAVSFRSTIVGGNLCGHFGRGSHGGRRCTFDGHERAAGAVSG